MKIINLLNRVIGNHGRRLKKSNEYMYWSPFISHHKPKLQINTQTQKWHCWVSNQGGHNLFQLFKKLKASKEHFDELVEIVGKSKSLSSKYEKVKSFSTSEYRTQSVSGYKHFQKKLNSRLTYRWKYFCLFRAVWAEVSHFISHFMHL